MLLVLNSHKFWYRLQSCLTGINHDKKGFLMGWNSPFPSTTSITWGEFDSTSLWCSSRYDNVPTPWRRILIKKVTVFQLRKIFPALCESKKFSTVYKRDCHWSQTWARWQFSKLLINLQISDLQFTPIIQKINLRWMSLGTK